MLLALKQWRTSMTGIYRVLLIALYVHVNFSRDWLCQGISWSSLSRGFESWTSFTGFPLPFLYKTEYLEQASKTFVWIRQIILQLQYNRKWACLKNMMKWSFIFKDVSGATIVVKYNTIEYGKIRYDFNPRLIVQ